MSSNFCKLGWKIKPTKQDYLNYLVYLKEWLIDVLKKAHKDGFILGLSGGIDSSLLSVIVHQTMGEKNYLVVTMPLNSLRLDQKLSELLIKQFGLKSICLNLQPVFETELCCLANYLNKLTFHQKRLIVGNIKTRLRTLNLYSLGQSLNYLVLGTTNYDEWMSGYFAKYGDNACDLAPLRCLIKGDVVALAKLLKIPKAIIERKPTASLYKGQFDEVDLGFSYRNFDQVLTGQFKVNDRMIELFNRSQHKRVPPLVPNMFRELISDLNKQK